ncbi:MAG: DUF2914 domain-containing protein [Candidatus Aminicenantes bacterium]|nr:DUF2914 domain-containing protein [Candidatus Aminicenantes bacterium]
MKNKIFLAIVLATAAAAGLGLAMAQEQQTPLPAAPPAPSLTVEEAVMCTAVVDRVPQGIPQAAAPTEAPAETPAVTPAEPQTGTTAAVSEATFVSGKIYCFTKVSGTVPTTIKHVWYFGDKAVHTMELAIGGSPWRTWSNKTVPPEMAGVWKVEIQDAGGTVLKTLNFSVK